MSFRKLALAVLTLSLVNLCSLAAKADWTAANYVVDHVIASQGNYVYSAGALGGYAEALTGGTPGGNKIHVQFKRTYSANAGDGNKTVTPTADLDGSKSSGGFAKAGFESFTGGIFRDTTNDGNPFDVTNSHSGITMSPTSATLWINAYAQADRSSMGSAFASSFVYFVD